METRPPHDPHSADLSLSPVPLSDADGLLRLPVYPVQGEEGLYNPVPGLHGSGPRLYDPVGLEFCTEVVRRTWLEVSY